MKNVTVNLANTEKINRRMTLNSSRTTTKKFLDTDILVCFNTAIHVTFTENNKFYQAKEYINKER